MSSEIRDFPEVREITGKFRVIRFIQSSQTPTVWVCQRCGAAVADYIKHAQWHETLIETLLMVGAQAGPGQPLGRL